MKLTTQDARKMPCPMARTMPDSVIKVSKGCCIAGKCPVWRWSLMADFRYLSAIKREAALMWKEWLDANPNAKRPKTTASFEKEATARVTHNISEYVVINEKSDMGFCGLGGKP